MGGMILKDFIFMKKQIKFYLLVIGIYCVLCFYWDQPSLVVTMACVLSIMFPVQIFGWDESCNWQMMERILPVSSLSLIHIYNKTTDGYCNLPDGIIMMPVFLGEHYARICLDGEVYPHVWRHDTDRHFCGGGRCLDACKAF